MDKVKDPKLQNEDENLYRVSIEAEREIRAKDRSEAIRKVEELLKEKGLDAKYWDSIDVWVHF